MKQFIDRTFNIRPHELQLVGIMGFILLSNDMARQTSGIVGISDFLDEGGINQILLVKAIDAVLIIITSILTSLIVDRYHRIKLLRWTILTFAGVFLVLWIAAPFVPAWLSAAVLFIMSQQQWLIIPLIFWVLANDIFTTAQGKRLFPLIGSWSFIGKILGIGVAFLPAFLFGLGIGSSDALTLNMVLVFNIGVYLVSFLLITIGFRNIQLRKIIHKEESLSEDLAEGGNFLSHVPSFRYLAIAIVFLMVVDLTTEFQFFSISKTTIPDAGQYQRFYSLYLLAAAIISFLVQSFITGRLIQSIGLKNSFFVVPFVAFGSVIVMLISPTLIATTGSVLALKVFRNTIDGTTRKSFESLVPAEYRGRVSLYMANYLPAIGTILGCTIAGITVYIGVMVSSTSYFYIYLAFAAIAGVVEIWAIFRMVAVYDSSLLNWRLKRRGRKGFTDIHQKLDI